MDKHTREIIHMTSGNWNIKISDDLTLTIKKPSIGEELIIAQKEAYEYTKLLDNGIKPFSEIKSHFIKECETNGLKYNIIEEKFDIFKDLVQSEQYYNLNLDSKDISNEEYSSRFTKLIEQYVDINLLKELKKVENIYNKYYKKSAEYFTEISKLKYTILYSIYKENSTEKYFNSTEDIYKTDEDILKTIISRTKEYIYSSRGDEFFFI